MVYIANYPTQAGEASPDRLVIPPRSVSSDKELLLLLLSDRPDCLTNHS